MKWSRPLAGCIRFLPYGDAVKTGICTADAVFIIGSQSRECRPVPHEEPAHHADKQDHASGDNNAFAEHEPCVEPVAHGDGTDGGGQGEGQVVGYGGYPEVGDHGQAESLCNADDYRNRNSGAGRVVDDVRQDNVKGDYRYDKGEFAVEIDSGDDLCEGIRRSTAVDERAERRAAGEEEEQTPHQIFLGLLPGDDRFAMLILEEEHQQTADEKNVAGLESG